MNGHEYDDADTNSDNIGHWIAVHPRCACGWEVEGYHAPPKAQRLHSGHAWQAEIAALDEREADVAAGRLCAFCEDKPPVHTLCRLDDHCDRNGCVKSCRHCIDELRDERD